MSNVGCPERLPVNQGGATFIDHEKPMSTVSIFESLFLSVLAAIHPYEKKSRKRAHIRAFCFKGTYLVVTQVTTWVPAKIDAHETRLFCAQEN
jgi:hypothetical protein